METLLVNITDLTPCVGMIIYVHGIPLSIRLLISSFQNEFLSEVEEADISGNEAIIQKVCRIGNVLQWVLSPVVFLII